MQDIGHMLHLHVAQPTASIILMHQSVISSNDKDAELNKQFPFAIDL